MRFSKTFNQFFNKFGKNTFKYSKQQFPKQSLLILGFQLNTLFFSRKLFADEKPQELKSRTEQQLHKENIRALKELTKYEVCKSNEIQEGQIVEFEVNDGDDKKYPVVLVRHKGKVYVIGGKCTYDGKTDLKDGICFENKLYCPLHGCAYNIMSGEVEYAPAIDDLPRFFAEEKNGKVFVYAPQQIPKRLLPHTMPRDYNDLRKVVIIGSGASAQACVETLRHNGYTGEIIMVTKETKYPYDKTRLTKEIKNLDYKEIQIRDAEWYKNNGVQILMGRECTFVDKTHGSPHIKLEDGLRLEYDALVIATGSSPENRHLEGQKNQNNIQYLENINDHKKLRENLKDAKSLTVFGANLRSLETISTIKKEYPNIKEIYVIDENKENPLKEQYGNEIAEQIIQENLKNNVWFVFSQPVREVKGSKDKIEKIYFENGLEIKTDYVLLFPNNRLGNSEWIDDSNLDQFDFDEFGRFKTTYHQRTDYKRIFSCGDCSATQYFASNDVMGCNSWNMAWHTGETAAYNILALNIPFQQIPFEYSTHFGKTLQFAGYARYWNEVHIDGSVKDWDFVAYYSFYDEIVAVAGTPSKRKAMNILNEAIRLEVLPLMPDVKKGLDDLNTIEQEIRKSKRSGCFKEAIYKVRYDPYTKEVLWQNREKTNQYYNFYDQGLTPVENKMGEEQHV